VSAALYLTTKTCTTKLQFKEEGLRDQVATLFYGELSPEERVFFAQAVKKYSKTLDIKRVIRKVQAEKDRGNISQANMDLIFNEDRTSKSRSDNCGCHHQPSYQTIQASDLAYIGWWEEVSCPD
jgi:hypothetical protein